MAEDERTTRDQRGTTDEPASTDPGRPAGGHPGAVPGRRTGWGPRLLGGLIVAVALAVLALIGAAFLPRWWAHRIAQVADGSFTAGIGAGLACGVAFTALPLMALRAVVRRHRSWTTRFAFLLVAGLLAAPNLLTLGIVLGSGKAAHAGERTMDVDAPGFRGATLAGAIAAVVLVALFWSLLAGRRRRNREIARLKDELRQRDHPPAARLGDTDPAD